MNTKACFSTSLMLTFAAAVAAHDGGNNERYAARLHSYNEVSAVSSVASGKFVATIDETNQTIEFELSYEDLEGPVTMAHIHFGAPGTNGGISIWLCQTAASPAPASVAAVTPVCPASPGTVSTSVNSMAVVGPGTTPEPTNANAGQGISAGQFAEILRAIRAGVTYANVHTAKFPGGEIRGQIRRRGRGEHHND